MKLLNENSLDSIFDMVRMRLDSEKSSTKWNMRMIQDYLKVSPKLPHIDLCQGPGATMLHSKRYLARPNGLKKFKYLCSHYTVELGKDNKFFNIKFLINKSANISISELYEMFNISNCNMEGISKPIGFAFYTHCIKNGIAEIDNDILHIDTSEGNIIVAVYYSMIGMVESPKSIWYNTIDGMISYSTTPVNIYSLSNLSPKNLVDDIFINEIIENDSNMEMEEWIDYIYNIFQHQQKINISKYGFMTLYASPGLLIQYKKKVRTSHKQQEWVWKNLQIRKTQSNHNIYFIPIRGRHRLRYKHHRQNCTGSEWIEFTIDKNSHKIIKKQKHFEYP